MKLINSCLIQVLTVTLLATPALAQEETMKPPRPTLTVADFDTDRTGWMPPPNLGQTLAELLTDRLVNAGSYRMMDRVWLVEAVDRRRIPFSVLLGRAADAGVEYLVAGSVTRFSTERRSSTAGGIVPLPFLAGLVRKSKTETVIGLTLRVIDVRTGEVVATATAESGAAQQSSSGGGVGVIGHVPIVGGKGSSTSGFEDRLLDTAVQQAITAAADKILAAAPRLGGGAGPNR